jgi:hypothetical protein
VFSAVISNSIRGKEDAWEQSTAFRIINEYLLCGVITLRLLRNPFKEMKNVLKSARTKTARFSFDLSNLEMGTQDRHLEFRQEGHPDPVQSAVRFGQNFTGHQWILPPNHVQNSGQIKIIML